MGEINQMNSIEKLITSLDKLEYKMKSPSGFADVSVEVRAETDSGHGCLYEISVPKFSIDGFCWNGDRENPEMHEVMYVLNRIFEDFNCKVRVVEI